MSLLKAIEHGKEHRTNGGHTFRHQDGCLWCMHNLLRSISELLKYYRGEDSKQCSFDP